MNTSSSGPSTHHQHEFASHSYKQFTYCQVCSKLLKGIVNQGYQCTGCKMNVHRACQPEASTNVTCFSATNHNLDDTSIPMHVSGHTFTPTKFTTPTNCASCGSMMMLKQGLKCNQCGVSVHRKCESDISTSCERQHRRKNSSSSAARRLWGGVKTSLIGESNASHISTVRAMEISEPTNFQHISHGSFDHSTAQLKGLPQDWQDQTNLLFGGSVRSQPRTKLEGYEDRIPTVLVLLARELHISGGMKTEGVFRVPPLCDDLNRVRAMLNHGEGMPPEASATAASSSPRLQGVGADPLLFASLIKDWFRSLPSEEYTLNLLDDSILQQAPGASIPCNEADSYFEQLLFGQSDGKDWLPQPSRSTFLWLLDVVAQVALHEDVNKMNPNALAVVLAPSLSETNASNPLEAMKLVKYTTNLVSGAIRYVMRHQDHGRDTLNELHQGGDGGAVSSLPPQSQPLSSHSMQDRLSVPQSLVSPQSVTQLAQELVPQPPQEPVLHEPIPQPPQEPVLHEAIPQPPHESILHEAIPQPPPPPEESLEYHEDTTTGVTRNDSNQYNEADYDQPSDETPQELVAPPLPPRTTSVSSISSGAEYDTVATTFQNDDNFSAENLLGQHVNSVSNNLTTLEPTTDSTHESETQECPWEPPVSPHDDDGVAEFEYASKGSELIERDQWESPPSPHNNLTENGFGETQARRICEPLEQLSVSTDNVDRLDQPTDEQSSSRNYSAADSCNEKETSEQIKDKSNLSYSFPNVDRDTPCDLHELSEHHETPFPDEIAGDYHDKDEVLAQDPFSIPNELHDSTIELPHSERSSDISTQQPNEVDATIVSDKLQREETGQPFEENFHCEETCTGNIAIEMSRNIALEEQLGEEQGICCDEVKYNNEGGDAVVVTDAGEQPVSCFENVLYEISKGSFAEYVDTSAVAEEIASTDQVPSQVRNELVVSNNEPAIIGTSRESRLRSNSNNPFDALVDDEEEGQEPDASEKISVGQSKSPCFENPFDDIQNGTFKK